MKSGISVVVPAYNEEGNIVKCLENLDKYFQKSEFDYEIIVVNDGSKDKTGELVKGLIKKIKNLRIVEHFPNRGYGGALKAGFSKVTKEFICFIPADNQFDIAEITKLFDLQKFFFHISENFIFTHGSDFLTFIGLKQTFYFS